MADPHFVDIDPVTRLPRDEQTTRAWGDRFGGSTSVADYNADPTGLTNSWQAFQDAMSDCPDGGTLTVPAGKYLIDGPDLANVPGRSIKIEGYGATLIRARSGGRLITLTGLWDSNVQVTSLTSGTITEAFMVQPTLTAAHAGIMPWKRGDVVKVFSDDTIPGVRDTGSLSGQFMTVFSTQEGSTTFLSQLRDPLSTNVRMARLRPCQATISGLEFDMTDAMASSAVGETIGMSSITNAVVEDVTIRRSPGQAITMASCYGYLIENTAVLWAWNDSSQRYGYGVNDNASQGGTVHNCRFAQVRHAFTDSNITNAVGSENPAVFGRSYGWHVSDCTADSCTASGFDTHAGGQNGTFSNCVVYNSPIGFSFRGREHSMTACRAEKCAMGIRLFNESAGGESWGHDINGLRVDGSTVSMIEFVNNAGGSNPNFGVRETRGHTLRGVVGTNISGLIINGFNISLFISDMQVDYVGAVTAGAGLSYLRNCSLKGHDITIDVSRSSGSGAYVFDTTTSFDSEIELSAVRLLGFSTMAERITKLVRNTATTNARISGLRTNYDLASYLDPTTTNSFCDYEVMFQRPGNTSAYIPISDTELQSATSVPMFAIAKTRLQVITAAISPTSARTLARLPASMSMGQQLNIVNTGSATLTILSSSSSQTELAGGSSKALTAGQSITLIGMASGLWKQIGAVI